MTVPEAYLADVVKRFQELKRLADKAIARVNDAEFVTALDPDSNSMAVIAKHLAGNLCSRWTDFLTSDGEKPDRQRDAEFILVPGDSRASILAAWERGWRCLFDTLAALTPGDLGATVRVRATPLSVVEAINRQLVHYGYHVGQLVLLARHFRTSMWESLSIPRRDPWDFDPTMPRPDDRRA